MFVILQVVGSVVHHHSEHYSKAEALALLNKLETAGRGHYLMVESQHTVKYPTPATPRVVIEDLIYD